MMHLKDGGYSQVPNGFASDARKERKGLLLPLFPIDDQGIPGTRDL